MSSPADVVSQTSPSNSSRSHFPQSQLMEGDITKMKPTVDGKPKGRSVSGRSWKVRTQKRASSLITKVSANNRSKTWEKRRAERDARKATIQREKELKEQSRKAAIEKKERRLDHERRRMENEFKNAQKFSQHLGQNADLKMKAMSKKQLRQIKKTRLNTKTGAVEYVGAYQK